MTYHTPACVSLRACSCSYRGHTSMRLCRPLTERCKKGQRGRWWCVCARVRVCVCVCSYACAKIFRRSLSIMHNDGSREASLPIAVAQTLRTLSTGLTEGLHNIEMITSFVLYGVGVHRITGHSRVAGSYTRSNKLKGKRTRQPHTNRYKTSRGRTRRQRYDTSLKREHEEG